MVASATLKDTSSDGGRVLVIEVWDATSESPVKTYTELIATILDAESMDFIVGRAPDPQSPGEIGLAVDGPTISRRHLLLRIRKLVDREGEVTFGVCDLNSSNKTYINRRAIEPNEMTPIEEGVMVYLGVEDDYTPYLTVTVRK